MQNFETMTRMPSKHIERTARTTSQVLDELVLSEDVDAPKMAIIVFPIMSRIAPQPYNFVMFSL